MPEYTLSNTAANIDSALTRVVSADTSPTTASQNMVTSGGVKAAIDAIGTGANGIITTDSFTASTLEDSNDGLTATDNSIPTSKAVVNYIADTQFPAAGSGTLQTTPGQENVYYTRSTGTTLPPGGYMIRISYQYSGDYYTFGGLNNNGRIQFLAGGTVLAQLVIYDTGDGSPYVNTVHGYDFHHLPGGGELIYRIRNENGTFNVGRGRVRNVTFNCFRVARYI